VSLRSKPADTIAGLEAKNINLTFEELAERWSAWRDLQLPPGPRGEEHISVLLLAALDDATTVTEWGVLQPASVTDPAAAHVSVANSEADARQEAARVGLPVVTRTTSVWKEPDA
jgi:hypothetical protein